MTSEPRSIPGPLRRLGLGLLALAKVVLVLGMVLAVARLVAAAFFGVPEQGEPRAALLLAEPDWRGALNLLIWCAVLRLAIGRFSRDALALLGRKLKEQRDPPPVHIVDTSFIDFASETFVDRYMGDHPKILQELLGVLIDPAGYFDRIKESVEVLATTQNIETTMMFRPRSASEKALVPLLAQRKGVLVDELDVKFNGAAGSTLSFIENQGAMCCLIEAVFEQLSRDESASAALSPQVLLQALTLVAAPSRPEPSSVREVLEILHSITLRDETNGVYLNALIRMIEFLNDNYFILGSVPTKSGERIKISVSKTTSPESRHFLLDPVRVFLGLRQREYLFTMERAYETVSYHLSLRAPAGMYIFDRRTEVVAMRPTATSSMPTSRRRLTFRDEQLSRSTKILHVYLRDYAGAVARVRSPAVRLEFRERPPGMLEIVALLSLFLGILAWFVGKYHYAVFDASEPSKVGSWPTVLFGVPTLLAGWLVARVDAKSLARISITTLAMILWLAVNSGAAVLGAGLKASGVGVFRDGPPSDLLGFEFAHPLWGVVMVMTALHAGVAVVLCVTRAVRYWLAQSGLLYAVRERSTS